MALSFDSACLCSSAYVLDTKTTFQQYLYFWDSHSRQQFKLHIYITIRAIGTQVMVKNRKSLTINNIGREYQPLLNFSFKSTNTKRISRKKFGEWKSEKEKVWEDERVVGDKMYVEERKY